MTSRISQLKKWFVSAGKMHFHQNKQKERKKQDKPKLHKRKGSVSTVGFTSLSKTGKAKAAVNVCERKQEKWEKSVFDE